MSAASPEERLPSGTGHKPGVLATSATNLEQRIASGLVMITIALGLLYAGTLPFAFLVLAVALVMSWEWGHLVRGASSDAAFGVHGMAVGVAVALAATGFPVLAVAVLFSGAIAVVPLSSGRRARLSATGVLYVGLPAVALLWFRHDPRFGFAAIVFLFLVVWSTDTMAYVFGRAIGGPKLWPSISPNKTWAGFIGGIAASAVMGGLFALFVPDASSWKLAGLGLLLGVIAQGGDLAESSLKRGFGVKDASRLIPGHGGVMDRMDSFVAVAIAAAIIAIAVNARAPAVALLVGG